MLRPRLAAERGDDMVGEGPGERVLLVVPYLPTSDAGDPVSGESVRPAEV